MPALSPPRQTLLAEWWLLLCGVGAALSLFPLERMCDAMR